MATITALGTGSGLDLESLVTKLMAAESVSLTALQKRQSSYETKISAMGTLRGSLSTLQTAANGMKTNTLQKATDKFASYTATLATTGIATATATTGAVAGKYTLEVSNLAQSQQLTSPAYTSSSTSVTASASTLKIELGTLSSGGAYTVDSARTYDISLVAGATLADVRDAINDSDAGVTASIVNGTNGAQLILSSSEGTNNVMRLSGVSGLNYDPEASTGNDISQSTPAEDAEFTLNGISVTSNSNKVTDALDGVTLELTGTNSGTPTTLNITRDLSTNITQSLQTFVTAYASANTTMKTLGAYNADSKVAGDLQGNSTLRIAQALLRKAITDTTSGSLTSAYKTLSNIGVTIGDTGNLSIDTTKLNAAIQADPTTVSNLVANIGAAFSSSIDKLIGTDGTVTAATTGLDKTVKTLEDQQTRLQDRLDAIEKRYRAQFSALDTLVSSLNSTGDYLTSYISGLNSSNN